ncbi:uncharacterized protein LODBEIA_P29970 [Lodderomyces beijingensis]|uniref:TRAM domain-containing protein n=1 Tax=Lodderomyces beijingensis TaxID=1775926 RepID=A0ABP0ZKV1_9ASCO
MTPAPVKGDKKRSLASVSELGAEPAAAAAPEQALKKHRAQSKKIKTRKYKAKRADATSPAGVLEHEIKSLCQEQGIALEEIENDIKGVLNDSVVEQKYHRIVTDVKILQFLSNGDSLAIIEAPKGSGKQLVVVPYGIPGDITTIKVFRTHPFYAEADLISVQTGSNLRDDALINCRYFGKCSGCQFQNIAYQDQLEIKRNTIQNAYKHFAPELMAEGAIPQISETQASPIAYHYRTKLTPHFNIPTKKTGADLAHRPNFGFGAKGRPEWRQSDFGPVGSILDIEECSIGTDIVNVGLKNERHKLETSYREYKRGATILLREDSKIKTSDFELGEGSRDEAGAVSTIEVTGVKDHDQGEQFDVVKTCVTQPRQIVQEIIGNYRFEFSAGEFFQNNNAILPLVTAYVKQNLPSSSQPNYLVDAYCGSGLFSIMCSESVTSVIGVEVSADSVKFAQRNAELNQVPNAKFIVGKAEEIFKDIVTPSEQTSVILDPPRKGCDDVFLNQLSEYQPARIVYISCNVHSQARDIEWFLKHTANGAKYLVVSVKGFDFFPQTHHVESVAILSKVEEA